MLLLLPPAVALAPLLMSMGVGVEEADGVVAAVGPAPPPRLLPLLREPKLAEPPLLPPKTAVVVGACEAVVGGMCGAEADTTTLPVLEPGAAGAAEYMPAWLAVFRWCPSPEAQSKTINMGNTA